MSALLQRAIRAYRYQEHRPLLAAEEERRSTRLTHLPPVWHGSIGIDPLVLEHQLTLSLELPGKQAIVSANDFVEVEDLRNVTRLVLDEHDIRGEVFQWSKQLEDPKRFVLTTERGSWTDVESIG